LAITSDEFLDVLREVGALKEGHFLLSSGRHSDRYVEKFELLHQPRMAERACAVFAERFQDSHIDVVVGPTTGGILLAFETARQLGVAAAYAERAGDGSTERVFRRGFDFRPGMRVLVIDDILTTGGSLRETLAALSREPVEVAGIGVLVDRSGGIVRFEQELFAIASLDIETWTPGDCPLCRNGLRLIKPGTTKV